MILIQSEPAKKGGAAESVDATDADMNNTIDNETAEQILAYLIFQKTL